jgi:hypothetical protein
MSKALRSAANGRLKLHSARPKVDPGECPDGHLTAPTLGDRKGPRVLPGVW